MNGKEFGAYAPAARSRPAQQRRGRLVGIAVVTVVFFVVLFSTSAVKDIERVTKSAANHLPHGAKIPIHNPFAQAVHEPPVQSNSSHGDSKWFSDWKWQNPFSSTITLDDTRSVLPPLTPRPHIYTYYDTTTVKEEAIRKEEYKLIQIWRRAWWAQGFKPIVLGRAEAMKNPHYQSMQAKELHVVLDAEMMRWLAWGHMGEGLLSNWLVLPMASRQDADLSYLRRGQFPGLTRYESLGGGLFAGGAAQIEATVKAVLDNPKLKDKTTIWEAIEDPHMFEVEPAPKGLAFYDSNVLSKTYGVIADQLAESKSAGLASLAKLITGHLHGTFLAHFKDGFNVLTVKPKEMTITSGASLAIANALNECPDSPLASSCPPNDPGCLPCKAVKINFRSSIVNGSAEFTLGTIPHPYTVALMVLGKGQDDLTVGFVRRDSARDPWLEKATEQVLTLGLSAYERIVHFKDAIVTDAGQAWGHWHTAERDPQWEELAWRFGFELGDRHGAVPTPGASEHNYPPELDPMLKALEKRPRRSDLAHQTTLLSTAKEELKKGVRKGSQGQHDMRVIVEAWSLADTEAWRFVRAFEARARLERENWEEDERRYMDSILHPES